MKMITEQDNSKVMYGLYELYDNPNYVWPEEKINEIVEYMVKDNFIMSFFYNSDIREDKEITKFILKKDSFSF
jgi:hypothetical protein